MVDKAALALRKSQNRVEDGCQNFEWPAENRG